MVMPALGIKGFRYYFQKNGLVKQAAHFFIFL